MFGFLNIDKPVGITSRAVVSGVQRVVRPLKVGHAGTLDPLASGVLLVAIGPATRLVDYLQRMPKRYTGSFLLGHTSDTEDVEGHVTEVPDAPRPSVDEVRAVLRQLVGNISQRPPAYSALKIKGRRAYAMARRGERVELAPRTVLIHELTLKHYAFPELILDVCCGSGTYIRALGRDVAEALGSCAVMSALRRTAIGAFEVAAACAPDDLATVEAIRQKLLPAVLAVRGLPRVVLSAQQQREIAYGRAIDMPPADDAQEIAATDVSGNLLAILELRGRQRWAPVKNFSVPIVSKES